MKNGKKTNKRAETDSEKAWTESRRIPCGEKHLRKNSVCS